LNHEFEKLHLTTLKGYILERIFSAITALAKKTTGEMQTHF
jgi:hypothetical protein